jgi:Gas vesicle synthesis protein GvpL/GvpF
MSTATYLYCVLGGDEPAPAAAPAGLPETSPPHLLALPGDGLRLVVAEAPLPAYSAEAIEAGLSDLSWVSSCAVAHERVIAHFAGLAPVVPMKLFTLFASDARAVAALAAEAGRLREVLRRVAGHAEWGVRIRWDPAQAKLAAAATAMEDGPAAASGAGAGRAFLLRKQAARDAARNLASRAAALVEEAWEALSRHATEVRRLRLPEQGAESGSRLLLDAAFLVPTAAAADFESAVAAQSARLAGEPCEVTLTGPWPPYNFVEAAG